MLPCAHVPSRNEAAGDEKLVDGVDAPDDDAHPVAFGKYRIHRRIARGGMGEVFAASLVGELGFEKRLVIKTILPEFANKPRFVEMFAAEAKTAVALSHGNIVPIYELGRAEDTFYIVMGYVDGPSVDRMLEQYRERGEGPPLSIALHIVREVLIGLAYAHTDEPGRPAIVHRDITPRNVLVDRSGQVRIVDFGIAMPANVDVKVRGGSTGYMAPEQARAETSDTRADVFSIACLLYELLTLRRAFPKEGVWTPPSLDGVAESVAPVLEKALSSDAQQRPQDAGAMLSALGPAIAEHAAVVVSRDVSSHLRGLFPEGWEQTPSTSLVASITPVTRISPQTYATRLTSVTSTLSDAPDGRASSDADLRVGGAAALSSSGASATATAGSSMPGNSLVGAAVAPAPFRIWVALALLGLGAGGAWLVARNQPDPDPEPRQPPPAQVAAAETATAPAPAAESSGPPPPASTGPTVPDPPPVAPVHVALGIVPRDAEVWIDDVAQDGTPPYSLEFPPDATVQVRVEKKGFISQTRTFRAADAGAATIKLDADIPKGKGYLQVFATGVTWAEVVVDGQKKGATPTRKLELPSGPHRVIVRCVPDVCPQTRTLLSKTVTIRPGETAKVTAH